MAEAVPTPVSSQESLPTEESLPIYSEQVDPTLEIVDESNTVDEQPQAEKKEKLDPLAYTKTGDFTSEIYKIFIDNIPIYVPPREFKNFLIKKLQLDPVKVKRPLKKSWAHVTFRNEEDRQAAIKLLNSLKWKNSSKEHFMCKEAAPSADPYAVNELRGENKIVDMASLREKTAPLHKMPYEDQVQSKLADIRKVFEMYKKSLMKAWPSSFPEDDYQFTLDTMKASPSLTGYRNKCEFTIGRCTETDDQYAVGFVKGSYKIGNISVGDPKECVEICSEAMLSAAADFKLFISTSDYPAYNGTTNHGVWKTFEVRTNRKGDMMVTACIDIKKILNEDKENICDMVRSHYLKYPEWSVFVKYTGRGEKYVHIQGAEILSEHLCGFDFQITPGSFFQVNTEAAEVLYRTIADTCVLDKETILLDVCCGTGTIGIILSEHVKHVHGIEIVEVAVEDAKKNAARNKIVNISFHAGNAKTVTNNVIRSLRHDNPVNQRIVAIVDPPRSGLHADVIVSLRNCAAIKELIYVSCDVTLITENVVNLCKPTSFKYGGNPFKWESAVAVDMFPHTKKFEVVMHFKR